MLRPSPSFLQKVSALPGRGLRDSRVYFSLMAAFQRSDSLFGIMDGPKKGLVASSATFSLDSADNGANVCH